VSGIPKKRSPSRRQGTVARTEKLDLVPTVLQCRHTRGCMPENTGDITQLKDPKPAVWEFLVGSASGPAVAVNVAYPRPGQPPRMTSITRGSVPAEALEATRQVKRLLVVRSGNYELRRLRIAGLSIGAFWLRSLEGAPDWAIPYHTITRELERMRPYPMNEFLAVIRPLAEKRLKFDDSPRQHPKPAAHARHQPNRTPSDQQEQS
jgi:hypothetical protein